MASKRPPEWVRTVSGKLRSAVMQVIATHGYITALHPEMRHSLILELRAPDGERLFAYADECEPARKA